MAMAMAVPGEKKREKEKDGTGKILLVDEARDSRLPADT